MPVPNCLDYCGFVVELEVEECNCPTLFSLLRIALPIWGILWFHINFRMIFSGSLKNGVGILIGIALNL